jgi:hypothetical protein
MELSKKVVGKAQYDYIARGSTDIQWWRNNTRSCGKWTRIKIAVTIAPTSRKPLHLQRISKSTFLSDVIKGRFRWESLIKSRAMLWLTQGWEDAMATLGRSRANRSPETDLGHINGKMAHKPQTAIWREIAAKGVPGQFIILERKYPVEPRSETSPSGSQAPLVWKSRELSYISDSDCNSLILMKWLWEFSHGFTANLTPIPSSQPSLIWSIAGQEEILKRIKQ